MHDEGTTLAEFEDLLRTSPGWDSLGSFNDDVLAWRGRAAALVEQWSSPKTILLSGAFSNIDTGATGRYDKGCKALFSLLHQARHDLRSQTVGPLSVALSAGSVFDYFDEVRKILALAMKDVLFVDPFLDADFAARYLPHIPAGIAVRLLGRERISSLVPAVKMFNQQHSTSVAVRSAPKFHDRFLFIDQSDCYLSSNSFAQGAAKTPVVLVQVNDLSASVLSTYEDKWNNGSPHT